MYKNETEGSWCPPLQWKLKTSICQLNRILGIMKSGLDGGQLLMERCLDASLCPQSFRNSHLPSTLDNFHQSLTIILKKKKNRFISRYYNVLKVRRFVWSPTLLFLSTITYCENIAGFSFWGGSTHTAFWSEWSIAFRFIGSLSLPGFTSIFTSPQNCIHIHFPPLFSG